MCCDGILFLQNYSIKHSVIRFIFNYIAKHKKIIPFLAKKHRFYFGSIEFYTIFVVLKATKLIRNLEIMETAQEEKRTFENVIEIIEREKTNVNTLDEFGMKKIDAICSTFRAWNINYETLKVEPNTIYYNFKNKHSRIEGKIKV